MAPAGCGAPATIFDPNFDLRVQLYSGSAAFTLPLKVAATAPAGAHPRAVEARFQSCNDVVCLPSKTVRVETTLVVRPRERHVPEPRRLQPGPEGAHSCIIEACRRPRPPTSVTPMAMPFTSSRRVC